MEQDQARGRRAEKVNRGVRILRAIGTELELFSAHLREVPEHLAIIDAMTDEAARREAKVVVRETVKAMAAGRRTLISAIAKLEAIPGVKITTDSCESDADPMTS